jgi:hypothetical protein
MPNTLNDTINSHDNLLGKLVGTVTNINDPLKLGRVQATVPGMYEGSILPWIAPVTNSIFGSGNQFGFFGSPQIGAKISVELQDGDSHKPLFTGGWRGYNDTPNEFLDPTVWGFKDLAGNILTVKGSNIKLESASGVTLNFQGSDLIVTSPGLINMSATSDINIQANGNTNLNTSGTTTLNSTGSLTVHSSDTVNIKGSSVNITADSSISINAPAISIN